MSLTRVAVGPITLKGLPVGESRPLTRHEVDLLRKVASGVSVSVPGFEDKPSRSPRGSARDRHGDQPAGRGRHGDQPAGRGRHGDRPADRPRDRGHGHGPAPRPDGGRTIGPPCPVDGPRPPRHRQAQTDGPRPPRPADGPRPPRHRPSDADAARPPRPADGPRPPRHRPTDADAGPHVPGPAGQRPAGAPRHGPRTLQSGPRDGQSAGPRGPQVGTGGPKRPARPEPHAKQPPPRPVKATAAMPAEETAPRRRIIGLAGPAAAALGGPPAGRKRPTARKPRPPRSSLEQRPGRLRPPRPKDDQDDEQ